MSARSWIAGLRTLRTYLVFRGGLQAYLLATPSAYLACDSLDSKEGPKVLRALPLASGVHVDRVFPSTVTGAFADVERQDGISARVLQCIDIVRG